MHLRSHHNTIPLWAQQRAHSRSRASCASFNFPLSYGSEGCLGLTCHANMNLLGAFTKSSTMQTPQPLGCSRHGARGVCRRLWSRACRPRAIDRVSMRNDARHLRFNLSQKRDLRLPVPEQLLEPRPTSFETPTNLFAPSTVLVLVCGL